MSSETPIPSFPDELPEEAVRPFLREGWEMVRVLAEHLERIQVQVDQEPAGALTGAVAAASVDALTVLTHRLRGSSALFGLHDLARVAGEMEQRVVGLAAASGELRRERLGGLWRGVEAVSAALEAIARGEAPATGPPAAPAPRTTTAPVLDPVAAELAAFAARDPEVLEFFGPEAREHTEGIAAAVADLAAGAAGQEPAEVAFRLAHTLKGAAYMVECDPMGELAHALEDLLAPVREGRLAVQGPLLRVLEDGVDVLQRMLAVCHGATVAVAEPLGDVLARVALHRPGAAAATGAPTATTAAPAPSTPGGGRTLRVPLDRIDQLMRLVGEAVTARGRLERQLERLDLTQASFATTRQRMAHLAEELERRLRQPDLRRLPTATGPVAVEERRSGSPAPMRHLALDQFSELELDRYDEWSVLARQVTELAFDLAEAQTELAAAGRDLRREVGGVGKLLRGLRSGVGRTRYMPLSALFRRFRRQVERAARDEDRPLQLMLAGEGVEVDAAVVERIADPLLHLVANALTHGIEPPALRIAAGKPALGTVSLRAAAHGPFIQLEVEDDGRGLDASELRRRAVELGLRTPEQVERLTDEEAWELVFLPGLTTAPELTATAGRGIGMDVVRTAVAELSGQIRIETLPGVGTRFTLRLPVTRVVSTALKVRVGEEVFALPTLNVRRMLEVPGGLAAAPEVAVDGAPVPVHPLARLLGLAAPAARRGPVPLVVVQSLGRLFALAVDELLGIEEVVVQELGSFLGAIPGFGGVTVDPTGRVVLILDPAGLERLADHAGIASPHPVAAVAPPPAEAEGPAVLLADDSLSVRKILSRQLTAAGYRVITAQDGQGALELLREQAVAVLITDIEMPRMNGFELLDAVRRRPESRNLPVVVVTTRSGAKHQDLAASLGSTAYLTKPVDIGELTAVLARWTAPPRRAAAQG